MTVERYERKGFDIILTDERVLVKTPLQVFLVTPKEYNYNQYIYEIKNAAQCGKIKDWNELCGMFLHKDKGTSVIKLILVSESTYL